LYYTNILEDGGTVDGREGGDNGDDDDVGKVDAWKLPTALGPDEGKNKGVKNASNNNNAEEGWDG